MYTKFDNCSFCHSRDTVDAHRNLNGSRDLTTPLSGMVCICGLALAMIMLSTKFEVSVSTHYKDMKGDTNCRKWWFGIVRSHSVSLEIAPFVKSTYKFLLVTMSLSHSVSEI